MLNKHRSNNPTELTEREIHRHMKLTGATYYNSKENLQKNMECNIKYNLEFEKVKG